MTTIVPAALTPRQLAEEVRKVTTSPREWMARVRLSADGRWYERVHIDGQYEIWLISWLPGQATGFHDHGGSSGAFGVVFGTLEEHQAGTPQQRHPVTAAPVNAAGSGRSGRSTFTMCATPRRRWRSACTPTRRRCRR